MNDLISRADAIEAVCKGCMCLTEETECLTPCIIKDLLSALPSAEAVSREFYEDVVKANHGLAKENSELKEQIESAEAVQGEWIRVGHDIYECSLCNQNVMTKDIDCYSYCHRCGAKMKGADNEID